jgi:hypothetical protein
MNKTSDLSHITKVINKKAKEQGSMVSLERQRIVEIIQQFVAKKNLIIYGGIALNHIVSDKDKFYEKTDYPDYDCLSYNAKKHAKELADILYQSGFEYTEVKDALHIGTYKIFVNFVAVADITQVTEKFFLEMLKLSKEERPKLKYLKTESNIAPTYLLKHFLLKELARPEGSLYRWKKVYQRMTLLYKVQPPKKEQKELPSSLYNFDPETKKIIDNLYQIIKLRKYPLVGNVGLGVLLGENKDSIKCCRIDDFFSIFEIIADSPFQTLNQILKFLNIDKTKYEIVVSKRFFYQEILPRRVRVYLKIKGQKDMIKLMTITDTDNNCYSIIEKNGIVIGSPYTILQFFYAYWLTYYVYEDARIHKKVQSFIDILENYIATKSTISERFSTNCFGHERTVFTMKRERWNTKNKRVFVYRPGYKKIQTNDT